jgi:transcription initiation factor TFIIB
VRELQLELEPQMATDFLPRFAQKLELADKTVAHARQLLHRAAKAGYGQGLGPGTLAGAALYLACREAGEPRSQKQVAGIAGITEITVRTRYQELARLASDGGLEL